ncbi:hypothetical protein [Spirosoma endbachense]|uniref:Uncharacterized protein n=1 Tax=Spirosoma endbachense TaxID=2666025 RepID=A0A6P1VSY0_9BACT|nr:hypothetical protein [Spirosoma endbachense]QHV94719.1 hypothetical protein GJR95_06700 [Spirosoma endbachense]
MKSCNQFSVYTDKCVKELLIGNLVSKAVDVVMWCRFEETDTANQPIKGQVEEPDPTSINLTSRQYPLNWVKPGSHLINWMDLITHQ